MSSFSRTTPPTVWTSLLTFIVMSNLAWTAPADLVVHSANILTMDVQKPNAQSFAVTAGRFVAVGMNQELQEWIGPSTTVLDLSNLTVVPGFVDAHAHPQAIYPPSSPYASVDCSPRAVKGMEDLIAALRDKAERTSPGQWVLGSRYQETDLGRHPTRWDLDLASTNHPIIISHSSGHRSVCNSYALRMAKIDRDTEDPPGAGFGRDSEGEPNGQLLERAGSVVRAYGPARPSAPESERLEGYRRCFREFLSRGLTTVGVAGTGLDSARLLEQARAPHTPVRLHFILREREMDQAAQRRAQDVTAEFDVRFGAIKLFHGNSLSGQTCWLSEPYANRPDYYGIPPARSQEALDALISKVHKAGLQACVHSNGDREIEMVLNAIESALTQKPRPDHRHRIEHGSVMTSNLLHRIKALGVVVAPHSYVWEHGDKMEAYGQSRWDWMHPARSMLDLGIPIAGNSDYPVSAADPLLRVQDHVLRQSAAGKTYGSRQRITAAESLRVWTIGAAYAMFAEDHIGSIASGKLADFVVLASDPTWIPADRIKDIDVLKTFIGGKEVWARD